LNLDRYIENNLSNNEKDLFIEHLKDCSECKKALHNWNTVKNEYSDFDTGYEGLVNPSEDKADLFVNNVLYKIENQDSEKSNRGTILKFSLAAAALIFITLSFSSLLKDKKPVAHNSAQITASIKSIQLNSFSDNAIKTDILNVSENRKISADNSERVIASIGSDTVGISRDGEITLLGLEKNKIQLTLNSGTIACSVAKRKNGEYFKIKAKNVLVTVIGTQFSVTLSKEGDVIVNVQKGVVKVTGNNKTQLLKANESVLFSSEQNELNNKAPSTQYEQNIITKLLSKVTETTLPELKDNDTAQSSPTIKNNQSKIRNREVDSGKKDIEKWQSEIMSGKYSSAKSEIEQYLKLNPNDSETIMLLATVLRKEQNFNGALSTYNRVINSSPSSTANRAKYLAGEICQNQLNNPAKAAEYFESYLKSTQEGDPNRAEANFRLARSYIATGQKNRADSILKEIIAKYGYTPIANKARKLLDKEF
ncbi:MAG: tetratricopeptide repeat protein, partial [Deltaproteobacteria bacterium]|nr:tetratricopeptide repeat protein [Deltaproteobacteria bacterium]